MDKRMYVAFGLSILVLLGFYLLFPPNNHPPAPPKGLSSPANQQETPIQAAAQPGAAAVSQAPGSALPPPSQPPPGQSAGRQIIVDTPLYVATLNTRGGVLASLKLKDYKTYKPGINWGTLLPFLRAWIPPDTDNPNTPVDMVEHKVAGSDPFGLRFAGDEPLTLALQSAVFSASAYDLKVAAGAGPGQTLTLTGTGPDGITVQKEITFHPDSYLLDYTVRVINYGRAPRPVQVVSILGEGSATDDAAQHRGGRRGPVDRVDGKMRKPDVEDIGDQLNVPGFEWLGIMDTYFISVARTSTPGDIGVYYARSVPGGPTDPKHRQPFYGVQLPAATLGPQQMETDTLALYMGPKDTDEMLKFGHYLERSLDLTLDFLASPLLALLRWLYTYTRNYGVAIILLTVVVRGVLFPLTYRGMVSMKRMQKLQPRMAALREKYKKDRERLNKEVMELYRRHKVNPLGGCLPIVLQIPIFFALYSALLGAIELRHSPFIFWVTDLSAHDGLYIGPIIMGGSMFLQQRFTPTTMDPTQAKLMQFMPLIFTAFMFSFPSGLVLYWTTSNLLSVAQQMIINRVKVPEPAES